MKWFYNLKIGTKLLSSFIIVTMIAGIVGYVGIKNIRKIAALDTKLYEQITIPISQLTAIATDFQRIRVNARDIIAAEKPEDKQNFANRIKELRVSIDKNADLYDKTIFSEEGRDLFKEFTDSRKMCSAQLDLVIDLAMANKDAEATALLSPADRGIERPGKRSGPADFRWGYRNRLYHWRDCQHSGTGFQ